MLQEVGAEVQHFPNAEEALEHSDITADYFVADYSLGMKLTGAEFLQEMQRRAGNPIKGVIVTGETSSTFIGRHCRSALARAAQTRQLRQTCCCIELLKVHSRACFRIRGSGWGSLV